MTLTIGEPAPDFVLASQHGEDISLSLFRGEKAVVLVFFPFAFSGICTGELRELRDRSDEFERLDAEVVAVCCDPIYANRAFADADGYRFSILSDFWPHGAVSRAYGTFDAQVGAPARGTFVINRAGILSWQVLNGMSESRNSSDYLAALSDLR